MVKKTIFALIFLLLLLLLIGCVHVDIPSEDIVYRSQCGHFQIINKGFLNPENKGTSWDSLENCKKRRRDYQRMKESQSLDGPKG